MATATASKTPVSGVNPGAVELWRRSVSTSQEYAAVAGILNAAHARIVDLAVLSLEERQHVGPGLHSANHFLRWQTGIDQATATKVLRIARRVDELPCLIAALRAGAISLDQAAVVAKYAPSDYDESATRLAHSADVTQLASILRDYVYDADGERPPPPEPPRGVTVSVDGNDATIRIHTSADAAEAFRKALDELTADLQRQHDTDHTTALATAGGGEVGERVRATRLDGFDALCEAGLRCGEAAHPNSERYLIGVHLHTDTHGHPMLTDAHGHTIAAGRRRHLLCDATLEAIFHDHTGTAISVGRKTRGISPKLRRSVLFRDLHRCRFPGCHTTIGLQLHHIVHWEDGGSTDTANLATLCGRHHRAHHHGLLDIEGNPNLPHGTPGALVFTDTRTQRLLQAAQAPVPVPPAHTPNTLHTLDQLRTQLHTRTHWRNHHLARHPNPPPNPDRHPNNTPRGPIASTPTGEPIHRATIHLQPNPPPPT